MIDQKKIGVGITTCNRPNYLKDLLNSLSSSEKLLDEVVIVNDGDILQNFHFGREVVIQNSTNLGIAKSKNKALKYLKDRNCDYMFLVEDDIIVKNLDIFKNYITASNITGIQHFNFGPGSPFNRKQETSAFDLHNRHTLSEDSEPAPKAIIDYKYCKIALYQHVTGMFSFYTKRVIEEVGLLDEKFFNAWEHVDHTYQIIKAGFHPPFWWFADLDNSHHFIESNKDSIKNSSTSQKNNEWLENVKKNAEVYKNKNGHYPAQTDIYNLNIVTQKLKTIKQKYKI
jgi:GT2 family glycosyltransferase